MHWRHIFLSVSLMFFIWKLPLNSRGKLAAQAQIRERETEEGRKGGRNTFHLSLTFLFYRFFNKKSTTPCLKSHFYRPLFLTFKLKIFTSLCSGGKIYRRKASGLLLMFKWWISQNFLYRQCTVTNFAYLRGQCYRTIHDMGTSLGSADLTKTQGHSPRCKRLAYPKE